MPSGSMPILSIAIRREEDLLIARQRARQIAQFLGFSEGDATRMTTALSEIARNALEYGGGGTATFTIERQALDGEDLVIRVIDRGKGIADLGAVFAAGFKSQTGMGIGIKGSRALMDAFRIIPTAGGGTTVVMAKRLPWSSTKFGPHQLARLTSELATASAATPLGELQVQNQALLKSLQEITERQAEIERLAVIAASARERAEAAQLVAERSLVVRDRFMALTTHELRTPIAAIIGYLDLLDMELATSFSTKQQDYFNRLRRAGNHLLGLTNDFLDMAQGDAGRLRVAKHDGTARHAMSEAAALVMPQAVARDVTMHLAETSDAVMYLGDCDRIRQILINLIGNAVSFTAKGSTVRIIASHVDAPPAGTALTGGPWCVIRVV
jgi:signal transduction histidine kinase